MLALVMCAACDCPIWRWGWLHHAALVQLILHSMGTQLKPHAGYAWYVQERPECTLMHQVDHTLHASQIGQYIAPFVLPHAALQKMPS